MSRARRIQLVEACRGLAALEVVLYHLVEIYELATPGSLSAYLLVPFSFGREAVIVFFVLSGFSIHYASLERDLSTLSSVRDFLLLRLLRLWPILIAAVALTLALIAIGHLSGTPAYQGLWSSDSLMRGIMTTLFVSDLSITPGAWFATPPTNPSLWSLSYEALYYLLYPVFWRIVRQLGAVRAASLGIIVGFAALAAEHVLGPDHLLNALELYGIWCAGALLAHHHRTGQHLRLAREWVLALPAIVLFVRMLGRDLLPIAVGDWLLGLAVCIPCFALLPNALGKEARRSRTARRVAIAIVLCAGASAWVVHAQAYHGSSLLLGIKLALTCAGVAIAALLLPSARALALMASVLGRFHALGGISYALYVFHYPLLFAGRNLLSPTIGIAASALLAVLLVFGLAYLFERRIQPWLAAPLRRRLNRRLSTVPIA